MWQSFSQRPDRARPVSGLPSADSTTILGSQGGRLAISSGVRPRCSARDSDGNGLFRADRATKVYPNGVRANDEISLHVAPGEVYGLLGPG